MYRDYPYNEVGKPEGNNGMEIPFVAEGLAKGKQTIVCE
jgi:hypothetical protein